MCEMNWDHIFPSFAEAEGVVCYFSFVIDHRSCYDVRTHHMECTSRVGFKALYDLLLLETDCSPRGGNTVLRVISRDRKFSFEEYVSCA
jgi:hypothetical protein